MSVTFTIGPFASPLFSASLAGLTASRALCYGDFMAPQMGSYKPRFPRLYLNEWPWGHGRMLLVFHSSFLLDKLQYPDVQVSQLGLLRCPPSGYTPTSAPPAQQESVQPQLSKASPSNTPTSTSSKTNSPTPHTPSPTPLRPYRPSPSPPAMATKS